MTKATPSDHSPPMPSAAMNRNAPKCHGCCAKYARPVKSEYDTMLQLERLESIEDEMNELGVRTIDEVRARIEELHRELDQREQN